MARIITQRLNLIISGSISQEKFGFLEGHYIHEAIGVAQEGLHSLNTSRYQGVIMKN
jgi:hypothetical protein